MAYYQQHVFICTNHKESGKKCCANGNGKEAFHYAKQWVNAAGLSGIGKVRVSQSGCLGRCSEGPCIAIYPEGKWYTYRTEQDVEAILKKHVTHLDVEVETEI